MEFRRFPDVIEAEVPSDLEVHLILDNYGTRKTAIIRNWLAKRPRFHMHFTPTYGSWLNLVERWFAELANKRIRRGAFRSVRELESAVREFIDVHNEDPSPSYGPEPLIRFWTALLDSRTAGTGDRLVAAAGEFAVVLGDRVLIAGRDLGRVGVADRAAPVFIELAAQLQFQRVHAADQLLVHLLDQRGIPGETAGIQIAHLIDQGLQLLPRLGTILHAARTWLRRFNPWSIWRCVSAGLGPCWGATA